ncbi:MAG: PAS domain S-box protein [Rhodobacteraceae bacterium]|nr:PAS domain S-box protein [Paracoccaceae bacterium]MBR9819669.1 PAS domain S-box protein [Paracoccaceae bacterium]
MAPLMAGLPTDRGYFSQITLNRENGEIDPAHTAMLRYVLPVKGPDGGVEAAVVLNGLAEEMLTGIVTELTGEMTLAAVDSSGAYMLFNAESEQPEFLWPEAQGWTDIARPDEDAGFVLNSELAQAFVSLPLERSTGPERLEFVAMQPHASLFAPLRSRFWEAALISVLIVALSAGLGTFISARLLRPVRRLSQQIRQHDGALTRISLDYVKNDEIGSIARDFERLAGQLIDRAEHAQAVWENCSEGLLTVNAKGAITNANPALQTMFGYAPGGLQGQPLDILIPERDRGRHRGFLASMSPEEARRMGASRVIQGLHSDGRELPVEIMISQFEVSGQARYLGVVHDVRDERARAEKLRRAVAALKRSNAELDQFAYIASHDLKAPLRAITNAARWIEEDVGERLEGDTQRSLALMKSRTARMDKLLSDLLEHSRIGRQSVDQEPVTVQEIVNEIRDLVDLREGFEIVEGPGLDTIHVPRMPSTKILLNLIGNGIKHHDSDTGMVRIEAEHADDGVTFRVSDDGPGIPADLQERAFGLFQTLRPRDQVEGSGMGLAIVEKSVICAGGTIHLFSEGRGCLFTVHLPLETGAAPQRKRTA